MSSETPRKARWNPDTDEVDVGMLAEMLEVSKRRVYQLHEEGIVYKSNKKRGRYLLQASVISYIRFIKGEQNQGSENPLQNQKLEATVRIQMATAQAKERENARAEKLLTPAKGIEEKCQVLFGEVYQVLLQIVPRIKRKRSDVPQWVLDVVDGEVYKCQNIAASIRVTPEGEYVPQMSFDDLEDDEDEDLA